MEPTEKRTFCQHLTVFKSTYSQSHSSAAKELIKQRRMVAPERVLSALELEIQAWNEMPDEQLGVNDEWGWAVIHHAVQRGVIHIVERAVVYNKQLLEQKTADVEALTPILIAVQAGNLEMVRALTELDSRLDAADGKGQGIVEMCSARRDTSILTYYAQLNSDRLSVWKRLVKLMKSDFEEESEPSAWCTHQLTLLFNETSVGDGPTTSGSDGERKLDWYGAFDGGVIDAVTHVLKLSSLKTVVMLAFEILFNVIEHAEVQEQSVAVGLVPVLAMLLNKSESDEHIVTCSATILTRLAGARGFPEDAQKHAVYPALVHAAVNAQSYGALTEVVDAMGKIVNGNKSMQTAFGSAAGAFNKTVEMYKRDDAPDAFLTVLSTTVSRLAACHCVNQKLFVDANILPQLVELGRDKRRDSIDIQLTAVKAFLNLVDGNRETQSVVLEVGLTEPLWAVVQHSADLSVKASAAAALWTATQADIEARQRVAELMGPSTFSEFLSTSVATSSEQSANSNELLVIGAEGIETLSLRVHQPETELQQPADSIIYQLVQLLANVISPRVMVAALKALSCLCVGIGYVPRVANQRSATDAGAPQRLLELANPVSASTDDDDDDDVALVRAEASLAFAVLQIGNSEIRSELTRLLHGGGHFDFSLLIGYLHDKSRDRKVRWRAGAALAAFAYNNIVNQRAVADCAATVLTPFVGIRYDSFTDLLSTSQDDVVRCWTAYQVTVLSPVIDDKAPAFASVEGIKTLVNCVANSTSDPVIALATDCIARLSHTRAGIPAALTSVSAVELLFKLLTSRVELIRSSASIALGYLSFDLEAERRLLNCCRLNPRLLETIRYYANVGGKLSPKLLKDWKHYERIGFPSE